MAVYLTPNAKQRFFDSNGDPLVGGKLYTYEAGTTTPRETYSSLGGAANANPVILDANGECDVWITEGLSYKFVLKDSSDVTQWTVDNISLLSPDAESIVTKTTTYTATVNDSIILVETSAGWTLSLFTAVGNSGKHLTIKKTSNDFNALTIDANGSETIDGATTTSLNTQYESIRLFSDGTGWQVLDRRTSAGWISYAPTYTGFGTISNNDTFYKRNGDSLDISIKFTAGTPTSTQARISLPSGLTVGKFGSTKFHLVGKGTRDNSGSSFSRDFGAYAINGNSYLVFSLINNNGTASGENAENGDAFTTNGDDVVFHVTGIPITGWSA